MARPSLFKQYLDAGIAFSELTRDRAEKIVKDLVKAGEVRNKQAASLVNDLLDRSRTNAQALAETIQHEVKSQLAVLEVVTRDAVERLEQQVATLSAQVEELLPDSVSRHLPGGGRSDAETGAAPGPASGPAAKAAPAKKAAAKKAAAKKAAAKKAPAKKKAAAKKAVAKKAAPVVEPAPTGGSPSAASAATSPTDAPSTASVPAGGSPSAASAPAVDSPTASTATAAPAVPTSEAPTPTA